MSRLNSRFGVRNAKPESVISGLLTPLDATLGHGVASMKYVNAGSAPAC